MGNGIEIMNKWQYKSPIGEIIILSHDDKLKGLWFSDQKFVGADFDLDNISVNLNQTNEQVVNWLDDYFDKKNPDPSLIPIDLEVTPYRAKVLKELVNSPYGETRSYKDVFESMNKDAESKVGSIRSVGGAVGHNPISIIIPCHRIMGVNGEITGYAGGIERKKFLLDLEKESKD